MRLIKDTVKLSNKIITSKSLSHNAVLAYTGLRMLMLRDSYDEVLLDLLESNIRRRGEIGGSAKKVGKRIKELERLYVELEKAVLVGMVLISMLKKSLSRILRLKQKNLSVTSQPKWEFQLILFRTINFFQK